MLKSVFTMVLLVPLCVMAQGITIGSNNPPDPAAVLELQSSSQGFLLSRLNTAQRNAIVNPPAGIQIYNTDTDCLEMYFSTSGWQPVKCGCTAFPNAVFSVPGGSINNPVTFTAPAPNMTYSWTFQGGSPGTATSQSAQVTWNNAGTYTITLTATDSAGCSSTHTDNITIVNCSPFTLNLTTCGQTGRFGPDQNQCNAVYGPGVVTVTSGIQYWTVPVSGNYTIIAAGARGGEADNYSHFGRGAVMQGDFTLNQGDVLKIIVGQSGIDNTNTGGGSGGGGSFVAMSNNNTPLIVAGGGSGGGEYAGPNYAVMDGRTTNYGPNYQGIGRTTAGGAGGSFSANGINLNDGASFTGGGLGGDGSYVGGFGGGGAMGSTGSNNYTCGGGGYSGGDEISGTGIYQGNEGGGGSFNAGTNQSNSMGANSNSGYVTIIKICP